MGKKKSHEEFVQEVFDLVGDEYEVIGDYIGAKEKIKIIHNKKDCNNIFEIQPSSFLHGTRCSVCSRKNAAIKNTRTHEEFIKEVYKLVRDEYVILEKYVNVNKQVKIRHNKENCMHEYNVTPNNFINSGNRCPICFGTQKRTTEEFKQKIFDITNDEFVVIGEYINAVSKIRMKHNVIYCNHEFEIKPNDFLHRNQRCPKCYENKKVTKNNFKDKLFSKYKNEYTSLEEYKGIHTKIKFRHNTEGCNKEFLRSPYNLFYLEIGCDCECKISKGERKITRYLNKNEILFKTQYKFEDLKGKNGKFLKFDFAIFNNYKNLSLLIEYDGEGHFEPFRFSKNEENNIKKFEDGLRRDQIKNNYCKENNIQLYRIPYWKFDEIESILNNLIHNKQVIIDGNFIIQ